MYFREANRPANNPVTPRQLHENPTYLLTLVRVHAAFTQSPERVVAVERISPALSLSHRQVGVAIRGGHLYWKSRGDPAPHMTVKFPKRLPQFKDRKVVRELKGASGEITGPSPVLLSSTAAPLSPGMTILPT